MKHRTRHQSRPGPDPAELAAAPEPLEEGRAPGPVVDLAHVTADVVSGRPARPA